ncbi:AraC family transcriptional regulator [Bacteroides sp. 51]|uniref:helix-turn-helix domain-containing protein n=1 Tax=Bacteroides sp. 51 TaxID=2302938 RepID=UPI0013D241CC|nr:AraC family transcriptional regulator [Bacteroides sp. 51]NDV84299.1 AraC family transcriptional regulator [Bacteroides sp. 51]
MEIASNKKMVVQVRSLMTDTQIYKDGNLKLDSVAGIIGVSSSTLSKAINRVTGKNFNNYVNEFRVKEAIRLLSDAPENTRFVHGFYKQAGFQSRASFYRTFKKVIGITPAEYKRQKAAAKKT